MSKWLIQDKRSIGELQATLETPREAVAFTPPLALAARLHDVLIKNNDKWLEVFGGAEIRLDVLVIQGNVLDKDPSKCFAPTTFRFPNIRDNQPLPDDGHGLLIYDGTPEHFLDISVMVSRDRERADSLEKLISHAASGKDFQSASEALLGLAVATPAAAAVVAAFSAAATIADLVYQLVEQVTGGTIGLYHGDRLAAEGFGVGRNPKSGRYDRDGMSFWFDVVKSDVDPEVQVDGIGRATTPLRTHR